MRNDQHTPGYGHNQDGHDCTHVIVQPPTPLVNCLKKITGKHLLDQMTDPPMECCRSVNNLTLEIRKSSEKMVRPDIYIMECACGARHRRLMVQTGAVGLFANSNGEDNAARQ